MLSRMAIPPYVQSALVEMLIKLQQENFLCNLPSKSFAARAAFYYGEIDAIHPFREGNSRTLRQFLADLAREAGYRID